MAIYNGTSGQESSIGADGDNIAVKGAGCGDSRKKGAVVGGKQAKKSDWTPKMEESFQSVFKPYPNRSCSNEARAEFAKINPGATLLRKMAAALDWQIPVLARRAARAGTVSVVPHFRRWLHNRWWEEEELDGYGVPVPDTPEPNCKNCGKPARLHQEVRPGVTLAQAFRIPDVCRKFA